MKRELPFFFAETLSASGGTIELPEESARHIVQVLRMKEGEEVNLTNGKGLIANGAILEASKKKVVLNIKGISECSPPPFKISIAVSLLKNSSRFEWFLEKATELGVSNIIPLICNRTEKQQFRLHRMQNILVSAMLQSRQTWLPELSEPLNFMKFVGTPTSGIKLIAWCGEGQKEELQPGLNSDVLVCIGPEGDFSTDEISAALMNGFKSVTLGNNRLRTETAALAAAVMLTR